jgi:hypothetical protein
MPAGVCVWITQATSARRGARAVDDEAGVVDAVAGARVLHHLAVEIDLHQARRGDLVVGHAVGVDQEVAFLAGTRAEMWL